MTYYEKHVKFSNRFVRIAWSKSSINSPSQSTPSFRAPFFYLHSFILVNSLCVFERNNFQCNAINVNDRTINNTCIYCRQLCINYRDFYRSIISEVTSFKVYGRALEFTFGNNPMCAFFSSVLLIELCAYQHNATRTNKCEGIKTKPYLYAHFVIFIKC